MKKKKVIDTWLPVTASNFNYMYTTCFNCSMSLRIFRNGINMTYMFEEFWPQILGANYLSPQGKRHRLLPLSEGKQKD